MKWYRCAAACSITELFVRSALANLSETRFEQDRNDLVGFEGRNIAHDSSDGDVLNSDKFGLQNGVAVFQKHFNNFVKVVVDLIQSFSLGMGTRETGNKTNKQASLWASLSDR